MPFCFAQAERFPPDKKPITIITYPRPKINPPGQKIETPPEGRVSTIERKSDREKLVLFIQLPAGARLPSSPKRNALMM